MGTSHTCQCRGRDNEIFTEVDGSIVANVEAEDPTHEDPQKTGVPADAKQLQIDEAQTVLIDMPTADMEALQFEQVRDFYINQSIAEAAPLVIQEGGALLQENSEENCHGELNSSIFEGTITEVKGKKHEVGGLQLEESVEQATPSTQRRHSKTDKHLVQAVVAVPSKSHEKRPKVRSSKVAVAVLPKKVPAKKKAAPKKDDFIIFKGRDCFIGQDAACIKADSLEVCKQLCRDKGYGSFCVWEGLACFRKQGAAECLANLEEVALATLYVYDKDGKHRQRGVAEDKQDVNNEDAYSPKLSRPASRRATGFPGGGRERQNSEKKDNFMVFKGKDCFIGQDAECLKSDSLDECKILCQEKGYGAFAVWEGLACFRSQAAAECLANIQDVPLATLYINLGPQN